MFASGCLESFFSDESARRILQGRFYEEEGKNEDPGLPTILVVDDEKLIADTLTEILEGAGFAVTTAYDAREALKLAKALRPAYLLTDVLMPRMNGVELAVAVRDLHPATKILLFSGNVGISAILEYSRKQGHEFQVLGKPVHPTALLKRIREL